MVCPYGCWGPAHDACKKAGIPIITVSEAHCSAWHNDHLKHQGEKLIEVKNFWEAVGVIMSMKAGIKAESVRRPIWPTKVIKSDG